MKKSSNFMTKTMIIFTLMVITICCKTLVVDNKSSVSGKILSTDMVPLSNVNVKRGEKVIAKSDKKGNLKINRTNFKDGDVLTFEKDNFVSLYKVIKANSTLDVLMKKRNDIVEIETEKGGFIKFGNGGSLNIPKNAFTIRGKLYKGNINVQATYIDVTNSEEVMSAPGAYIAENKDGNLYPLTSFGIIEINVSDSKNNIPLDLKKGTGLKISYPITTKNTPDIVNLYELNEETGYWSERSFLRNNGSTLQGVVTSVNSAWNADDPCSDVLVCVKIKVVFTNGNPGCGIGAKGISYQGYDGLYSPDINGYVQFMVCPDSVFELGACHPVCLTCPGPVYQKTIDLSTVTMNPSGCTDLGTWVIQN
ncbi:hypothetical protein [Polaribacter sp. Hel1_85]|uniref:hypothetical protein n=1 Tax=Polaribacter sp. Hel1_85 TaxID=1250005 RepID=UPI00052B743F|nr:hypothetical protein [Polaribacter sp. Hel1_85]KGL59150.1 hypothetical protein PHEL85_3424 [Polaribacter sp. Hel1_85]